jgi:hypothetical protein
VEFLYRSARVVFDSSSFMVFDLKPGCIYISVCQSGDTLKQARKFIDEILGGDEPKTERMPKLVLQRVEVPAHVVEQRRIAAANFSRHEQR